MSDNRRVVDHTARQGLEVAKHIHVRHLWLQTARESGQRDVRKVHTSRNAANVVTKALPFGEIRDLCRRVKVLYDGDVLADSNRCAWNVGKGHRPSLPPRERDIMGQPSQCNKPNSSMGAHTSCRCGGGVLSQWHREPPRDSSAFGQGYVSRFASSHPALLSVLQKVRHATLTSHHNNRSNQNKQGMSAVYRVGTNEFYKNYVLGRFETCSAQRFLQFMLVQE